MQHSDFQNRTNLINFLDEVSRPKKKSIFSGQLFYALLVAVATFYIGKIIYHKLCIIEGQGQVLFKKLDIQFPGDVKIDQILKREGDIVRVGDTLFTYNDERTMYIDIDKEMEENVLNPNHEQINWYYREKNSTQKNVNLLKIEIRELEKEIGILRKDYDILEQAVILDLKVKEDLRKAALVISSRETDLATARSELSYYQSHLQDLRIPNPYHKKRKYVDQHSSMATYAYTSPIDGTITKINKENYEVALESQIVMSIHKPDNLYIKAFYPQKVLKNLSEGDIVKVEFPDGTESKGQIARFYFATYRLPQEFQNRYEPVTRSIAADIIPILQDDLDHWKAFYKLNVDISRRKWSF